MYLGFPSDNFGLQLAHGIELDTSTKLAEIHILFGEEPAPDDGNDEGLLLQSAQQVPVRVSSRT
jgi:hypothetical protein